MGFIIGIWADNFEKLQLIPLLIITPLVFLGGSFYSISMLPEFWQGVSQANPILYMVNTFRYGLLGVSDINVVWAFTMVTGFCILLYSYSLYLLGHAKKLRS